MTRLLSCPVHKLQLNLHDQLVVSEVQVYCEDHFNYMTTLSDFMPIYKPITFLDGGSNTGMASILFSHAMMGNGEVLAVEAHPDTFEVCSCVILQSIVWLWIARPVNTVVWSHTVTLLHTVYVARLRSFKCRGIIDWC